MQAGGEREPRDVLVLFCASVRTAPWWFAFWKRWLGKPGYHHVLAAWFDPSTGVWVVIDPLYGNIEVRTLGPRHGVADILRMWPATEAVHVRTPIGGGADRHRGLMTCVAVVKSLLGIGGWAVTPWQLRRQLARLEVE